MSSVSRGEAVFQHFQIHIPLFYFNKPFIAVSQSLADDINLHHLAFVFSVALAVFD